MNQADLRLLKTLKKEYPWIFKKQTVLELGSLNINGSVRVVFDRCWFTGVDKVKGKNVERVAEFKEVNIERQLYDVLLSFGAFEHDPDTKASLDHVIPAIRKGGYIIFSWAGPKSTPHGDGGYYPLSLKEMKQILEPNRIRILQEGHNDQPDGVGEILWLLGKKNES